jgi:hypothetical protein
MQLPPSNRLLHAHRRVTVADAGWRGNAAAIEAVLNGASRGSSGIDRLVVSPGVSHVFIAEKN